MMLRLRWRTMMMRIFMVDVMGEGCLEVSWLLIRG